MDKSQKLSLFRKAASSNTGLHDRPRSLVLKKLSLNKEVISRFNINHLAANGSEIWCPSEDYCISRDIDLCPHGSSWVDCGWSCCPDDKCAETQNNESKCVCT
jgi:hypothetical protein